MIKLMRNNRGTALLVSLLVMGVLIGVSLALSTLILRENRLTRDLLDSGKAFYAAESGIELALDGLHEELAGWQPVEEGEMAVSQVGEEAVVEYFVDNRCNTFPCLPQGFEIDDDLRDDPDVDAELAKTLYQELDVNETVTVPLFVVNDQGNVQNVDHFTVEFWSSLDPGQDLKFEADSQFLSSWDVLRWKLLGIEDNGEAETISDLTALAAGTSAALPSWFGSVSCSQEEYQDQRYLQGIHCAPYAQPNARTSQDGTVSGICSQLQAREYYDYRGAGENRKLDYENIYECYSIAEFLDQHELNYLTLSNFMNKDVLKPSLSVDEKDQKSKIYVRVELFSNGGGNQTAREVAELKAHGYSGKAKQSLAVRIQKGTFMPVFNFSVYSTYGAQ